MGNRRMWLGLSVALVGLGLSTGCMSPPADAEARLAALETEDKKMDAALDTVEDRLLVSQSLLMTWQELGRRHQQVSELHCKVADEHFAEMMKHQERQTEKARQLKRGRNSVAAVDSSVLTSGTAPARRTRTSNN